MTAEPILVRGYTATNVRLAADDHGARTVSGRLVPYGEVADVSDMTADGFERYREAFAPGTFARQIDVEGTRSRAQRVAFVDQHSGGLGKVGYALSLREAADGLYGELRVLPAYVADVETMLSDGVDGLSVGFVPHRSQRQPDGVILRTRATLIHVALEAAGAYESAKVLAMRAAADDDDEEAEAERERERYRQELEAWLGQDAERAEALHARVGRVQ